MSHDGSSAKSYIRHSTEKERLDNLAFASFPEDYLPYAAAAGHRVAAPPPYLLWGDDRRRRAKTRRRKPRCAGALLCAIALVVLAILAVVAISVYLGVVTNLFRSPVVSVSGRFISSDQFSEELSNSTSPQFLKKAESYQAKVEKAFLSSSLEPAFIAARIYSFRPGLLVFFRVYLDRRKLVSDGVSPPVELVRGLVTEKLAADPESVYVEENEELLSEELRPQDVLPASTTSKPTTERSGPHRPKAGGVGEWHPVPIEDSVSPSFAERPAGGIGSVRSHEESNRNPVPSFGGSVRVLEEPPSRNPQSSANPQEGIGSVRVIDGSPRKPQFSANSREGTGTGHVLEENPARNSPSANSREGVGSVRLLDKTPPKTQVTSNLQEGVGSVRVLEEIPPKIPRLPVFPKESIGSVRLIDDSPKENAKIPTDPQSGIGFVHSLDETPLKNPSSYRNPAEPLGIVRGMEEPPTLAPFVSLVVRNRSRSDRPRNLASKLQKDQLNIGVGSIHEIITEVDSFPLFPRKEFQGISSRLLDTNLHSDISKSSDEISTRTVLEKTSSEKSVELSDNATGNATRSREEQDSLKAEENFTVSIFQEDNTEELSTLAETETHLDILATEQPLFDDLRVSSLGNLLFRHTLNSIETTSDINRKNNPVTELAYFSRNTTTNETDDFLLTIDPTIITIPSNETEIFEKDANFEDDSDVDDIHSSIVNHSHYPTPETHYHTVETSNNISSEEPFEIHTMKGHGFHQPSFTDTVISSNVSTTEMSFATDNSVSENQNSQERFNNELHNLAQDLKNETKSNVDALETYEPDESEASNNTIGINEQSWSEDDEFTNATTDDISQQGKVVPQLKSDFISNDIGEEESGDEGQDYLEDGILRHITTVRPQQNGTDASSAQCPVGSVVCSVSGDGCGVRCDMRKDCPDNEDEQGCSCSDLLRAMGQSQKVCDGVDDCSDGSDESECPWCQSVNHFRCPGSRACITKDRVCDGKDDCPEAQDERRCVNLAESSAEAESFEYHPQGYLVVRRSGRWGKLCLDSLSLSPDLDSRIRELGRAVCSALTYRNVSSSIRTRDKSGTNDSYYQISTDVGNNKSSSAASSLFEPSTCNGREVLRVHCQSLECGLRPSVSLSQRRRIVGGRSAGGAGTWPWAAALYREGDFQCGAALISDHWLVSASHCFYSSQGAFWTARLGVLRRGSELPSGSEQVRQIKDIILHPHYEDVGFINDIALLRMDRAVSYSDSLRPICLPSSPVEDASLWHGRRCSVVGWGKLYEIGHTFPDSLQEVRLPVISSSECLKRSLFLPAYRITPNMFCAGFDRGGRDACLGDSGGPMACQRPADGRWVLLGVTSNGDGCGRPGRPGVYTQVAGYLSWIRETILKRTEFTSKTGSESVCNGVRCRLGRCISQSRICDGKRDCAGGEDEERC